MSNENQVALVPVPMPTGATASMSSAVIQTITASGDLGQLTEEQRAEYLLALCASLDLNPLSRPIEIITLKGKTVPYAKKDCTDQLRNSREISLEIVSKVLEEGLYTVIVRATTREGRKDEDVGSVFVGKLAGEELANAMMKAITKAKRRVTLSICGLGLIDESEVDSAQGESGSTIADKLSSTLQGTRNAEPARDFVAEYLPRIKQARNQNDLDRLAHDMSQERMTARELKALENIWRARRDEFAPPKKDEPKDKKKGADKEPKKEEEAEPCYACDVVDGHAAGCPAIAPAPAAEPK